MLHKLTWPQSRDNAPGLWGGPITWCEWYIYHDAKFPIICANLMGTHFFVQKWTDTVYLFIHHLLITSTWGCPSLIFCVPQGGSCWKETTLPCCRVCLTEETGDIYKSWLSLTYVFPLFLQLLFLFVFYITWILLFLSITTFHLGNKACFSYRCCLHFNLVHKRFPTQLFACVFRPDRIQVIGSLGCSATQWQSTPLALAQCRRNLATNTV